MIQISNMVSPRSGRPVANQYLVRTDAGEYFQSYKTIIAFRPLVGKLQLDTDWAYSRTTTRYRNLFTGLSTHETEKRIATGEITVTPLNI